MIVDLDNVRDLAGEIHEWANAEIRNADQHGNVAIPVADLKGIAASIWAAFHAGVGEMPAEPLTAEQEAAIEHWRVLFPKRVHGTMRVK